MLSESVPICPYVEHFLRLMYAESWVIHRKTRKAPDADSRYPVVHLQRNLRADGPAGECAQRNQETRPHPSDKRMEAMSCASVSESEVFGACDVKFSSSGDGETANDVVEHDLRPLEIGEGEVMPVYFLPGFPDEGSAGGHLTRQLVLIPPRCFPNEEDIRIIRPVFRDAGVHVRAEGTAGCNHYSSTTCGPS